MSKDVLPDLFPAIEPYASGLLRLDGRHRMYWEQSGNPAGVPVVFVHGGPGAGTAPAHRRFFDPDRYRIILFDQRGAGLSLPTADITDNTTPHLVEDMERLRKHLGLDAWLVFGGSWGSTLALAYGQEYPERCLGFILRGVFLFRQDEVDWFIHGMGRLFPEAGRRFVGHIPPEERGDLLGAYYRRLTDPDPRVHGPAAEVWCWYEESCSRLVPRPCLPGEGRPLPAVVAMARIEAHYMMHGGFMDENQLLRRLALLHRHPVSIVQGRYDVVCPIATADELARVWPGAQYTVVPDAGHSAMEPGIRTALVAATQKFRVTG
jgi:proline iminopeptidase